MKMAVVGCEASGKTVFMCAMADYYGRDAANNPLRLKLTPENAAANKFERFQFRQMRCQRQWPPATPPDRTIEIKWSLRHKGEPKATVELLEFGGETYRAAFRDNEEGAQHEGSVAELLKYLGDADFIVVLVSLKALLSNPKELSNEEFERETEALWVTRGILEFIRKNRPNAGVVIGLTQADKYRNELGEAGDPLSFFSERWPTVASAIGDIPVVEVASVSKTDEDGNPAEGFNTRGILPVMRIFAKYCFGSEDALENGASAVPVPARAAAADARPTDGMPPPRKNPLSSANAATRSAADVPAGPAKANAHDFILKIIVLSLLATGIVWLVSANLSGSKSSTAEADLTRSAVITVTNTLEKIVEVEKVVKTEVPVTNTVEKVVKVEKVVEVPVTNTVEKVVNVEVPVTNTVEKVVEKTVTNTVEKIVNVKVPVTNTVERIVEKVVTNVVEKVVEKQPANSLALTNLPPVTTVSAQANPPMTEAEMQKQVPPGYRIWTDYNGCKIIARWSGVAVDESGITLITRYNRRIDAVLWKFSPEDQAYIKAEIKKHTDKGELMSDGIWIRNPLFKTK